MKNKRGAELAISTLVIIVVAVIVLIVLVVGFTTGWSKLWGNITAFFGGSNVDTVVKACETACLTKSADAFCTETRSVTKVSPDKSCKQLAAEAATQAKGFKDCPGLCPV